jgi:HPt (histidine-containing phosphotransfer) domain-containing protein
MAQLASHTIHPLPALPAAPVIDLGHLARMTFGDRSLEREVLQLFDRQAELLLTRMRSGAPPAIAALAHTLRGSACGIGADNVAQAAQAVEQSGAAERLAAMDALDAAIVEARAAIAKLLRD